MRENLINWLLIIIDIIGKVKNFNIFGVYKCNKWGNIEWLMEKIRRRKLEWILLLCIFVMINYVYYCMWFFFIFWFYCVDDLKIEVGK